MRIAARMAVETVPVERGSARRPVEMNATMRAQSYHGINVVVRNLSEQGFMAETRSDIAEGSFVRLKLPCLGTVLARIAWSKCGQVGGEFLNAVNPLRLQQVLGITAAGQTAH
ncbi:PilZ domain-containing protein [Sphingomonas sp. C3-2]|uniref:PilZ domain-containing protein n=1 Tax=Sphingomonas sp. C3-2 TaxID=3062169 RepID=UPI00294B1A0B|nr:PilZ domain-containing protein [Sphingomonas sp. C3-2]WOK35534.1 PilZ domain-containing protein [Sphingomonas sp. C3-2]